MRIANSIAKFAAGIMAAAALATAGGCLQVHVDPVEVKPITINVNIKYVDQQLDDFFAFEKKYDQSPAATQPATRTASADSAIDAELKQ
jgi:hypothetical protein